MRPVTPEEQPELSAAAGPLWDRLVRILCLLCFLLTERRLPKLPWKQKGKSVKKRRRRKRTTWRAPVCDTRRDTRPLPGILRPGARCPLCGGANPERFWVCTELAGEAPASEVLRFPPEEPPAACASSQSSQGGAPGRARGAGRTEQRAVLTRAAGLGADTARPGSGRRARKA